MPFRRLGDPLYGFSLDRFGHGQVREPFSWNQWVTFEAGALTPYPTGLDGTGGADPSTLAVNAAAAIRGNYGLSVGIPDTNTRYGIVNGIDVTNLNPTFQFLFDPNSINMANADQFFVFTVMSSGAGSTAMNIIMRYLAASGYALLFVGRTDAPGDVPGTFVNINDEAHLITCELKIAENPGDDDGFLRGYIDGELVTSLEGIDNDTQTPQAFWLGATFGVDVGTTGALLYDNFGWADRHR